MIEFYMYLFNALLFTMLGQLFYKYYYKKKNKIFFGLTLISFVLVPFFNYKSLVGLPIDIVYMATALTIVMVMLSSVLLLKESVNKYQLLGCFFILVGIIIYNL